MDIKGFQFSLWSTIAVLALIHLVQCDDLPCAESCVCYLQKNSFKADCSDSGLYELPDGLSVEVQILDLSGNEFEEIPYNIGQFEFLTHLDLSNNRINRLRATALEKLTNLEVLHLSKNNLTRWADLHPNDVLRPAVQLKSLDLSRNPLTNFGNLATNEFLISDTVETLNLKNCGIQSIHGRSPIGSLTNLRTLTISHNPLRRIQKLASPTLTQLDLSHCELNYIHHDELLFLPSLSALNLSNNYRLMISTKVGSLTSTSLMYIDMSLCNVDLAGLGGFKNLKEANLRGNMIRRLEAYDFLNNTHLEMLDLSSNVIDTIASEAFRGLTSLKWMNLSVNVIANIPEDVFYKTPNLTTLLLTRNYLTSVSSIKSASIKKLDVNLCEIQYLFPGSLAGKFALTEINLSRNLIATIPDHLDSTTLLKLDLSYNRISNINNNSFHKLPKLTSLTLAGNRFTSMWLPEYFGSNPNLQEVHINDNTWRCDCDDPQMEEFYHFLTQEPPKVWNMNQLICHSPANFSGMNWQEACYYVWNPPLMESNDRILMFMMIVFIGFAGCIIIVMIVRRLVQAKLKSITQDRQREVEEARERIRMIRMQAQEQESQINAPDPRDLVSPPTYDEALLLPRLDGSYFSLADVDGTPKKPRHRKKGGRRRTKSNGDIRQTDDDASITNQMQSEQEIETLDRSPVARRRAPSLERVSVVLEVVQIEPRSSILRTNSLNNRHVPESDI